MVITKEVPSADIKVVGGTSIERWWYKATQDFKGRSYVGWGTNQVLAANDLFRQIHETNHSKIQGTKEIAGRGAHV